MYAKRLGGGPLIAAVAGPYERWVFSQELGRPFSFNAITSGIGTHFSAVLERAGPLPTDSGLDLRVPPMWTEQPVVTPFAMHAPADDQNFLPRSQDQVVADLLQQLGAGPCRVNLPIDAATWPEEYYPEALPDWDLSGPPPKAIVAVIDDGLPFMHRAFLNAEGQTRLVCCWLQSARAEAAAAVPFGREITNGQINELRREFGNDEPAMYRAAGSIDTEMPELGSALRQRGTHGAHVLGLAAGNTMASGAAPLPEDVAIIAVQLPNTVAWDTSGFGKEMSMLSAVEYVFHRARALAQHYKMEELPMAVNFSYGWSASGHDGGTAFERGVRHLIEERRKVQPKTAFVVPSGNHFEDQMHARIMAREFSEQPFDIGWRLQPDDRTSSYLEMWFPYDFDTTGWNVRLIGPDGIGTELPVGSEDPVFEEVERATKNIGQMSADTRGGRRRVVLAMIPTVSNRLDDRRAPHGLWRLQIVPGDHALAADQSIDIWLQRDDDPSQLGTGGRQSQLVPISPQVQPGQGAEAEAGEAPLPLVRGFGAMNGIGTASVMTRVAGRVHVTDKPADYSGAQQLMQDDAGALHGTGAEITVNAVSDDGDFVYGIPSIGTLSGSRVRLRGTSAAAASVTRAIVQNFVKGDEMFADMQVLPQDRSPREIARSGGVKVPPICGITPAGTL